MPLSGAFNVVHVSTQGTRDGAAAMRAVVIATVLCLGMLHAPSAISRDIDRPGGATYNPRSGRIVVTVVDAFSWGIVSASKQLTGPDDVVLSGVLPASPFFSEFSIVTNTDEVIGEANFADPMFSYGPLDLGRVAQPNIPKGDLRFICICPLGTEDQIEPVQYVPEPITCIPGWFAATFAALRRSRGNARLARSR